MFQHAVWGRARALLGIAVLLPALAGILAFGSAALAGRPDHISGCRTDPIIFLSNGTRVQMTTQIGTTIDHVHQITYTLHAPAGTTVNRIIYVGNAPEVVRYFADAAPDQYNTTTLVDADGTGVPVEAIVRLTGGGPSQRDFIDGYNGDSLPLNFQR